MSSQRYWAAQEGDASSRWVDPHLTATGIEQAHAVHAFWKHQLAVAKRPAPQTYYCSPLYRCLETANLTFTGLDLPADRPYKPIVKEVRTEISSPNPVSLHCARGLRIDAFDLAPPRSQRRPHLRSPQLEILTHGRLPGFHL